MAACEPITVPVVGLDARASTAPAQPPAPDGLSLQSQALAAHYKRVEDGLVAKGLLRRDMGLADAPFGQRELVENFIRIALFEEYQTGGGRVVARQTESVLHRWERPVRLAVSFGASVPAGQQARDRRDVAAYAARLERASGHPVRLFETGANFHLFIVNEAERRDLGPEINAIMGGISDAALAAVTDMPRSTYCLVFAVDQADDGAYTQAVAVVRGEHPDLLRLSCIHEELAQGLGLANDSPAARPSIFNDDEEFALLTGHDELLLRMLYDPRLRPGMNAAQARPVAEAIAAELLGETEMVN